MNNQKYLNGYWPKIQYWQYMLSDYVLQGDIRGVDKAHNKLNYFIGKQWELEFGKPNNVIGGVDFSESLEQLNSLSIR